MPFIRSTSRLHHKPIFTAIAVAVSLIAGLVSFALGPEGVDHLAVTYGNGIEPIQWLTSCFVQTNLIHVIISTLFLGIFGVLIEGKLGSAKFAGMFLVLAVASTAIEQKIMADGQMAPVEFKTIEEIQAMTPEEADAYSAQMAELIGRENSPTLVANVGSSTVLVGLLATCVLWSPLSVYMFGKSDDASFPLMGFVILFAIWFGVKCYLSGFSEGGHPVQLIGFVPGIALAITLLATNQTHCSNEDLLSVMSSSTGEVTKSNVVALAQTKNAMETAAERKEKALRERRDREEAARQQAALIYESKLSAPNNATRPAKIDPAIEKVSNAIEAGKVLDAIRMLNEVDPEDGSSLGSISQEVYDYLTRLMLEKQCWFASAMILEKSIAAHPEQPNERRLLLGQVLLILDQPDNSRSVLAKVNRADLNEKELVRYRQLVMRLRKTDAA